MSSLPSKRAARGRLLARLEQARAAKALKKARRTTTHSEEQTMSAMSSVAAMATEQERIEQLVKLLETAVTATTNLIAEGSLSGGYRYKGDGKGGLVPSELVEEENLRLAALELIVKLTGDYDDEKYESWRAVLEAHKKTLATAKQAKNTPTLPTLKLPK